eukprot:4075731-Amphidinium_carterae.1
MFMVWGFRGCGVGLSQRRVFTTWRGGGCARGRPCCSEPPAAVARSRGGDSPGLPQESPARARWSAT